jgi:DNA repair protein RecN (Recombination protein N)
VIKQTFEDQLQQFSSIEAQIEKTKKEISAQHALCLSTAKQLSKNRKASVSDIEEQVKSMLANLSMPHAQFHISISELEEFSINGLDKIEFLFSANKGQDFKEIGKAASGGELSRLMLCLKSLLAERTLLPSIVFDEIDTGVSGDVGDKIGIILEQMGSSLQVIVITHLPQMASKGDNHLFVYKTDQTDKTTSHIKVLKQSERIEEIAKMLSSGKPTEAALKNAKELLKL